jgi:hypothetical protein
MSRSLAALPLLLAATTAIGAGPAPDVPEAGSAEAIASATTDPRFLSPWVAYLPASATVPSPRAFFGRIMGAPGEMVDTAKAHSYCRALAAASPRVRAFTIGRSEEGREILMLAVADEAGIARVFALGELSAATVEAFGAGAEHFETHAALADAVRAQLKRDVRVLVKGSRGSAMDKVVRALLPATGDAPHAA